MPGVRYGTMISRPHIQCLVSYEEFGNMEGATGQNMEGTLRA